MQGIAQKLHALGVKHLALDSRQLDSSTAFVAIQGEKHHGLEFLDQAVKADAPCVLVDAADKLPENKFCEMIPVEKLRQNLGNLASAFYGHPSQHLKIHAITGTNGKTSCSQFIAQALMLLGEKCGVIGTLGMGVWPALKEIPNTTPDAITLQRFLADCVVQGIKHVSMEASSIALEQDRMQGCQLDSALFTNLSQDHLDYHGSMENYGEEKKKLFAFPNLKHAIINLDDPFGKALVGWIKERSDESTKTYGKHIDLSAPTVSILSASYSSSGITAQIQTAKKHGELKSPLLGQFNLENLLAVFTWMLTQNIPFEKALAILPQLKNPRGRMEVLQIPGKPTVVVDYAHTPDALEKALKALRVHCKGKLWCVFGCGGNRDKTKRPVMGEIAMKCADEVIVTSDNPRDEGPEEIINDIVGWTKRANASVSTKTMIDRTAAIEYAITHANPNDIILIAGKGHETYQEIKGKKKPFDDLAVAKEVFRSLD